MPKKSSNITNQVNQKLDMILRILVGVAGAKAGTGTMRPPVGMPPQKLPMNAGMPQRPQAPQQGIAQRPLPRPPVGSMPIRGR